MGKYGFFKIESEIEDKIDMGKDGLFDNTVNHIISITPEMYVWQFENLQLEFGRPLNTVEDFFDFIVWLHKKNIKADIVEYNFVENFTTLKERSLK